MSSPCFVVGAVRRYWLALAMPLLFVVSASGQINLLYQEGFNDDGDGTRYTMFGRGQEVLEVGPGLWEHNFNVDVIGLPAIAPAKRAAILWASPLEEPDFTESSLMIWDNLIDYMIDGKAGATIGFFPDFETSATADFLSFRIEEAGHTPISLTDGLPDPADIDLIIHTEGANPDPNTIFGNYAAPIIAFNAGNHDDTLISSIGAVTAAGPAQVTINPAFADHPVLGGLTGVIDWVQDLGVDVPLQGIGASTPAGSKTLATYIDPDSGSELPALLVIEAGDPLLGAFTPVPEGIGFIVGGDMNERFPNEGNEFTTADTPRAVVLNAVDVSGQTGVKVSIALAATDVDFESPDFLRVSYSEDADGEFIQLAQFDGMPPGVLTHPDLGPLNPNSFTDFTFEIPDDVNNLIIKVEAFSTFPNEVVGFDNIRIFTGEALAFDPLDCDQNGTVDLADLECSNEAGITANLLTQLQLLTGDLDGQGGVAFPDFLILSANFGTDKTKYTEGNLDGLGGVAFPDFLLLSANFGKSFEAAASAVPEPSGMMLLSMSSVLIGFARRRRR